MCLPAAASHVKAWKTAMKQLFLVVLFFSYLKGVWFSSPVEDGQRETAFSPRRFVVEGVQCHVCSHFQLPGQAWDCQDYYVHATQNSVWERAGGEKQTTAESPEICLMPVFQMVS